MKHMKLLLAAALGTAAWCSASQAQTVVYSADYAAPPTVVYQSPTTHYGYTVRHYRDYNGRWRAKPEAVAVIGAQRTYVYPETTIVTPPVVYPPTVVYTPPVDSTLVPRY
jgi:hypothetical protein